MEGRNVERIDIIIPVYKPDTMFLTLIERLERQNIAVGQIIVMNTEQKYFDRLLYGTSFQKEHRNLVVKHLSKREFDHGKTRNIAVQHSDADYFIMMTQDAVPADEHLVEELIRQVRQDKVAVAYARQLAAETSSEIEKYARNFNYPDQEAVKTREDLGRLGIKTFFCSNVCAAYDRKIFDELGGFVKHTIFNEDMIYAAKAVEAGYGIAYAAKAKVFHSHDYTNMEQFHRNFDLGVSHAQHPEVFDGITAESEGIRLIKKSCIYLIRKGKPWLIIKLIWHSGCKYAGYFLGKRYQRFSRKMVIACSMNKDYWK